MSLFDLLFIALFLTAAGTLLSAAFLAIFGRGAGALRLLRTLSICAGVYIGIVAVSSIFWPRTVLRVGERQCFDDWCIGVESASRQPAGDHVTYLIGLRVASTARRVTQRENNVVVYLADQSGRPYRAVQNSSDVPLNVQLGPGESVAATRVFEVPADAREPGLVIAHEGGFPIGWFIIGDDAWFHKAPIVRLQ